MLNQDNHWNKGRSYKKFNYTYQDIAEVLGISVSRVRHLISEGKLNPTLKGIVEYIGDD